ncbi:MAG: glycosyltransferase family 4 protein [Cyclobacteriaceae bacterium]|nr:glycosyltransferase family 4 protein [Cyclobacteriaceae bacterium]
MAILGLANPSFKIRLGVVAQTNHWKVEGEIFAYEPYLREMQVWAELFSNVDIFAPLANDEIKVAVAKYGFSNARFSFVSYVHTTKWWGAFVRLAQLPMILLKLASFIWKHDVILIRSPSHFGLFAHIFVYLLGKKSITKYAGYFSFFEGERIPSIIERNFIRNVLRPPHYALVYESVQSSKHLIPFIPAAISRAEISWLQSLRHPQSTKRLVFYSLGKLIPVKNFDLTIKSLGLLFQDHAELDWEFHLIGDGDEFANLKRLSKMYNISERIFFEGKLPYKDSMRKLATSDIIIMPGVKEGWPKVIIEGWAAGAVPVVADAGISNQIIKDKVSGFLFKPKVIHLKDILFYILTHPHLIEEMRLTGWKEVQKFSIENFSKGIEDICRDRLLLKT